MDARKDFQTPGAAENVSREWVSIRQMRNGKQHLSDGCPEGFSDARGGGKCFQRVGIH